jgi:hypothetical protein
MQLARRWRMVLADGDEGGWMRKRRGREARVEEYWQPPRQAISSTTALLPYGLVFPSNGISNPHTDLRSYLIVLADTKSLSSELSRTVYLM